jgi:hypothetical protein
MNKAPESFLLGETQAAEVVDDEFQPLKANSFTKDETNVSLVLAIGDDGEFRWMNNQNVQRKARYKSHFWTRQLSVFPAPIINRFYKNTKDLSWFRPLLAR